MPANNLTPPWTEAEEAFLRTAGLPDALLMAALNKRFGTARSQVAIRQKRSSLGIPPTVKRKLPPVSAGSLEVSESDSEMVVRSNSATIRTVEDLLAHIEADMTKWEVGAVESTRNEQPSRNESGDLVVTEYFRLHVRLKPKSSTVTPEIAVQRMIDAAFAKRNKSLAIRPVKLLPSKGTLQAIVIADPHIGKHAWAKETGYGDYDLNLACTTLRDGCAHLMQETAEVRHFWLLGDYYHYDTPTGTTTKGTPLERDGRVQKMIGDGSAVLFDVLEESARQVPTVVTLVPGNHDVILTWALQRILQSHFRFTKNLTVDGGFTPRKYLQWGKCLLGLTHGDKAKKILPGLMAREAATEWGQTTLREIHTGHLHHRRLIDTIEGVTMHQHPALCPPDSWHAAEGFASDRGMQSFLYHSEGAPIGMRFFSPDLGKPVARGAR
jgi:hypothetical protein